MKTSQYRIDLVRQMADCDANFIRLLKLMPELESFRERCFQLGQASLSSSENSHDHTRTSRNETNTEPSELVSEEYVRDFMLSATNEEAEQKVRINVVEVFRYTSTLFIQQLTRVSDWIDPPGILVRVYHDASTAEAVAYQGHKAFLAKYAIPNPTMYHQDEKRQINEFLGEWLSLCLQAGRSVKSPTFTCAA
ncbi:MAG: DUF1249 domain-containing protein [Gammaproteobacteria bacterium]